MYTTNITDGWASPKSYIKQSQNSGLFTFRGKFSQNGILYEFSLREQRNNAYLLRGSIAVIDPSTGKVLKIIGKRRDEWVAKHPNQSPDTAGRALDVRANVLLQSLDIDEVKKGIACAASKLYQREVALIIRAYGSVVTPATITPLLATLQLSSLESPCATLAPRRLSLLLKRARRQMITKSGSLLFGNSALTAVIALEQTPFLSPIPTTTPLRQ